MIEQSGVAGNAAAFVGGSTGTGAVVLATSPTITTPTLAGDVTNSTGNEIFSTAGKGANFTANTPAAGMTSQLLNWYEEGAWTPTDASGAGLSFTITASNCIYTRLGRMVFATFAITYPATVDVADNLIGGLPFTSINTANDIFGGGISYSTIGSASGLYNLHNSKTFQIKDSTTFAAKTNVQLSAKTIRGTLVYMV